MSAAKSKNPGNIPSSPKANQSSGLTSNSKIPKIPVTSSKPDKPIKLDELAKANKPGKDTIYVDIEDEITSIIDKVEGSGEQVVALVLPKRSAALQSIVNMRLLKRSADQAQKNVVLITNEASILPLAGAAEVHVAKNLQSKPYIPPSPVGSPEKVKLTSADADKTSKAEPDEKDATLDYHRSIGELGELAVTDEADAEEPETIHLAEDEAATPGEAKKDKPVDKKALKIPKDKKLKVPNFDKFRLLLILGGVGLILLIVFFIVASKVLPKASINIQTEATSVSANFDMTATDSAKAVDTAKNIIPSVLKTSDQTSSQSAPATGQQNNGDKATGSVSMSAGSCTGTVPSDVPAGNGVTASGLTFITQQKTSFAPVISGGKCSFQSTNSTSIASQSGGAKYNVPSGTSFTVNNRSDVSAIGSASGGTDDNVTIVTQADVDNAKSKVTSQSSDDFSKAFQKTLTDQGLYLVDSTLKIADPVVTPTPAVGQPGSSVSVNIKITYSVLAFKTDDLKQIVSTQLKKQIDPSRQQFLDTDLLKNVNVTVQSQSSPSKADLKVTADASATPNIDVDAIKKQAGGLKSGDIQNFISSMRGVQQVDVKLSPFWISKAPKNPAKITVTLKQVSNKNASQ